MANESVYIGWLGPLAFQSSAAGTVFPVPMTIGPLSITSTAVTSTVPVQLSDISANYFGMDQRVKLFFSASTGMVVRNWADSAYLPIAASELTLGADVSLSRGAANRLDLAAGDAFRLTPTAFASLPTGVEGAMAWVNNSSTATWGATIAGGGANKVLAVFNGTNWTVAGA